MSVKQTLAEVKPRIARDQPVDLRLANGGRLHVERQLPFLIVHRSNRRGADRGLVRILRPEASYLRAPDDDETREVQRHVVDALDEIFGMVLLLEVWAGWHEEPLEHEPFAAPAFCIRHHPYDRVAETIQALERGLATVQLPGRPASVVVEAADRFAPPGMAPLARRDRVHHVGVEIAPVWYHPDEELDYHEIQRAYRQLLGPALREGVRAFAVELAPAAERAAGQPVSVHDFGRRLLGAKTLAVDRDIAAIGDRFDWLRTLTPVHVARIWQRFEASGFAEEPILHYRPLGIDPDPLRRELINIRVEDVEDPSVDALLREKQQEIDRRLSMLAMRGTRGFLYGSLQLYGDVDASLLAEAEAVLEAADAHTERRTSGWLDLDAVTRRAHEELAYYRESCPDFPDAVEAGADIAAGLMVSRGRLLLAEGLSLPSHRLEPLLQHEIGTHVVTYYNGTKQPIRQLATGLASYDALQEGLGVFAEYLAGGLTPWRMRVIALRVIAVDCLTGGASFVETFRALRARGAEPRDAFSVTLRVFRGGGLTKDAVYLRGLRDVLAHIGAGHDLDLLFLGKFAFRHVPLIQELRRRGVLEPACVLPRILRDDRLRSRIEGARGLSPAALLREGS